MIWWWDGEDGGVIKRAGKVKMSKQRFTGSSCFFWVWQGKNIRNVKKDGEKVWSKHQKMKCIKKENEYLQDVDSSPAAEKEKENNRNIKRWR